MNYFSRNKRLLADSTGYRPLAHQNRINLNWWHIKYGQEQQNFGDMLSPVIFDYMCQYYKLDPEKVVSKTRHLYIVGSILFFENQDAVVWGAGSLKKIERNFNNILHQRIMRTLDIRAVRGPLTKENLVGMGTRCLDVFGDPAVLLPLIYKPKISTKKSVVVIPHIKDKIYQSYEGCTILDLKTNNWQKIVDCIASAQYVISSSLHGIIVAESYGIPAILLRPQTESNLFKYYDYYYGTRRTKIPSVGSIDEGLSFDISDVESIPDLSSIQKGLIQSFPYDIWE